MNEVIMLAAMPPLKEFLLGFLGIVLVVAAVGALIYGVEQYVVKAEIPKEIKMLIGLVLIILIVIWGINFMQA